MAINQKTFREDLFLEHLEEAAYQYETRRSWLLDEEIGWQDLEDLDEALERHIDALVAGEELALAVCLDAIPEADFGTLHAIVRVFCRLLDFRNLSQLWVGFDFDDVEKITAVADGLKWDCPDKWLPHLLNVFSGDRVEMFPVIATGLVYHSPKSAEKILSALNQSKPRHLLMMMKALDNCGCCLDHIHAAQLQRYLAHSNLKVVATSIGIMMMAGDDILQQCRHRIFELPFLFAIGGNQEHSRVLTEFAAKGTANADCLLALGLSGNLESVPHLLNYLLHPDYAPAAAQALQLISGANLYEDVHIEEKVEKEELFGSELEGFEKNVLPKNIDGLAFGVEVNQLTVEQAIWSQWFQENKGSFTKGIRYRNGRPFSAVELLNNLISNQSSYQIRQLAYHELVIRYKVDIPFHIDDLVEKQKLAINKIHQWIKANIADLNEGTW
jgi:hypothetical protein